MLYVLRDESQQIIAVSERKIGDSWDSVDLEDEALHAFLQKNPNIGNKVMQAADADFIRVLEDVIDLLCDKQVIQFTDLPNPVQTKLLNRRRYREMITEPDSTHLLDNDGEIF